MTMIGMVVLPASFNISSTVNTSSRLSMLGNKIASAPILATAYISSLPQGESMSLTRTTTSREPKPPSLIAATTFLRDSSFASIRIGFPKSRMTESTISERALLM